MDVCILHQAGETLLHRHMQTTPEALRNVMAPYRPALVVAVACLFTWDWLADLCADAAIPFVLGHALSMKAIHGGKANHDQIDSHKSAVLLRGGLLPQASVSRAERRAPRDLLRRRRPLAPTRGARLAPVQNTNSQSPLPALGTNIADKANRDGVAALCADPAVHNSLEVDLARVSSEDARLRDVALPIVQTATQHDATPLSLLHTVPGIGKSLRLVLLYDIPHLDRFPRGQECASSCRLVTCTQAANGTRSGTSGATMGHAHLTWAFSEAAVFCLRDHPAGQQCLTSVEKHHDTGQALTLFAHQGARAGTLAIRNRPSRPSRPFGLADA